MRTWWTGWWKRDVALTGAALIGASLVASSVQQGGLSLPGLWALRIEVGPLAVFGLLALGASLLHLVIAQRLRNTTGRGRLGTPLLAVGSSVALFAAVGWALSLSLVDGVFLSALFALQLGSRALRILPEHPRRTVLAGIDGNTIQLARSLDRDVEPRHVVGFIDEFSTSAELVSLTGFGMVSDFKSFGDYLKTHVVDEVLICVPPDRFNRAVLELIAVCREQGVSLLFETPPQGGPAATENVQGRPFVSLPASGVRGLGAGAKRALDIAGSALALLALSPLLIAVGLAIRLTSKGPALFVQERVGLGKRSFRMYKFRTMGEDAEVRQGEVESRNEVDGPAFKMREDPRVTPLGRVLRRTSIDELPQLYNVLRGEMSLVGPRPLPLREYAKFSADWHRRRFSVRPGLTCLWQVSGRSTLLYDERMRLDLEYIDRWSLALDLQILVRTVPAILTQSGAY